MKFECTLCGYLFESGFFPDSCWACGAPASDIIDAETAEQDRRINKRDEYLEEERLRNG